MTEQNNENGGSIREEFQNLGENLKMAFTSAWESEERQKLQGEIEAGMRDLGTAMNEMADDIRTSETGQKIRQEVDDFGERVRSGEVESKVRAEIHKALQALNTELGKLNEKFSPAEEETPEA